VFIVGIGYWHVHTFHGYGLEMDHLSLGFDAPVFHPLTSTPEFLLNNRYFYSIPLLNMGFALLILLAIQRGALSRLFGNGLLVWIGKISYGVYIYHLAFSYGYGILFRRIFDMDPGGATVLGQVAGMLVYLGLLLGIASRSYYVLERPFLRRRERNVSLPAGTNG
jgi:peptidoglycan/LPS O-acetylase OafA/YrhL